MFLIYVILVNHCYNTMKQTLFLSSFYRRTLKRKRMPSLFKATWRVSSRFKSLFTEPRIISFHPLYCSAFHIRYALCLPGDEALRRNGRKERPVGGRGAEEGEGWFNNVGGRIPRLTGLMPTSLTEEGLGGRMGKSEYVPLCNWNWFFIAHFDFVHLNSKAFKSILNILVLQRIKLETF